MSFAKVILSLFLTSNCARMQMFRIFLAEYQVDPFEPIAAPSEILASKASNDALGSACAASWWGRLAERRKRRSDSRFLVLVLIC